MKTRIFLLCVLLIHFFICSCASKTHIKQGLIIEDQRVGLAVINYWANIGRQGTKAIRDFDQKLLQLFTEEIEANTLYRLVATSSSDMDDLCVKYRGTVFSHDLIDQPEIRDRVNRISRISKLDYFILIVVEDFNSIIVQILESASGDVVFEKFVNKPFRSDVAFDVVSKFPGFFPTKKGCDRDETFDWIDPVSEGNPTESYNTESGAVFLVDESSINVQIKPGNIFSSLSQYGNIYTTQTRHVAIKILNQSGYSHADIEIPFVEGNDIADLQARTITANGETIILAEDQIHEVTAFPEHIYFSDLKAKKFTMPGVEPGCIVEYRYKQTTENVALWGKWFFKRMAPVLRSSFALDIPRGLKYKIYLDCPEGAGESILEKADKFEEWEKRGGYRESALARGPRLTKEYTIYDLPAAKVEEDMPPLSDVLPQLKFCSATFNGVALLTSWYDLANWYKDLIKDSFGADEAIRQKVSNLLASLETDAEKAEALHCFVQSHTRYVAKELGLGKIVPQKAEEVHRSKYGDCKGFTALLVSMLRAAGINAYPALVRTKDSGELDEAYVSLDQFNHMIVYAELDTQCILLDPTTRAYHYGQIPWQDQGIQALVLKEEPEFVEIPVSPARENSTSKQIKVKPLEDGTVQISGTISFQGQDRLYMQGLLEELNRRRHEEILRKYIASSYPNAQSITCSYSSLEGKTEVLEINFACQVPHFYTRVDDILVFKPGQLAARETHQYSQDRIYPLVFDCQRRTCETCTFEIPEGYRVKDQPQSVSILTDFGKYQADYHHDEEALFYTREHSQIVTSVSHEDVAEYIRFREQIAAGDQDQVVLEKSF